MGRKFRKYNPPDTSNLRVEIPRTVVHIHSYGKTSPYFRALSDGKLIGTHCASCRLTFLPPRPDCPECWGENEWVRFPTKGTVATNASVRYPGAGYEEDLATVGAKLPSAVVYVKIEGVDTKVMSRVEGCDPDDVYIGMPVEARFVANANLNALDLYWVPSERKS